MSNELFDWGKNWQTISEQKEARATRDRELAERQKQRRERREQAAEQIEKVAGESVEDKADATHIWIGIVETNIRNETKAITGKSLPVGHYARLEPVIRFLMSGARKRNQIYNGEVDVEKALKGVAIRLTKSQAMKAKLSNAGEQVILEDPDGSQWKQIAGMLAALKAKRDMTFHNDIFNIVAKAIGQAAKG